MQRFHINNPEEPRDEPSQTEHYLTPGTRFSFHKVGDQIRASISIPVQFA